MEKSSGPGGGSGGDDGEEETGASRGYDSAKGTHDNTNEFTLVNSRNIEMKKFTGESNFKLSYLEFNESQREFVGIIGRDGDVLNHTLTWAEQRGDRQIDDDRFA